MSSIFPTEDTIEKLLISLTADKTKHRNAKIQNFHRTRELRSNLTIHKLKLFRLICFQMLSKHVFILNSLIDFSVFSFFILSSPAQYFSLLFSAIHANFVSSACVIVMRSVIIGNLITLVYKYFISQLQKTLQSLKYWQLFHCWYLSSLYFLQTFRIFHHFSKKSLALTLL